MSIVNCVNNQELKIKINEENITIIFVGYFFINLAMEIELINQAMEVPIKEIPAIVAL